MNFTKLHERDLVEWRNLLPLLNDSVCRVASKTWPGLSREDLEDIVAETYAVAFRSIEKTTAEKFWAWVTGIAHNKTMERGKEKYGPHSIEGKSESIEAEQERLGDSKALVAEGTPVTALEPEERLLLFDKLMALVEPDDRALLLDRFGHGMKGHELSDKYGWGGKGEKSSSKRCTQALNRVRKVFAFNPGAAKLLAELDIEMRPL